MSESPDERERFEQWWRWKHNIEPGEALRPYSDEQEAAWTAWQAARPLVCAICRGVGSHGEPPIGCSWCKGTGQARAQLVEPQERPESSCETCGGTGQYFAHADNCHDDLCALNGDIHSCDGQVIDCVCAARVSAQTEPVDWTEIAAQFEREYVRKVLRDLLAGIERAAWSEPFKSGLITGVEEVQERLRIAWDHAPHSPPKMGFDNEALTAAAAQVPAPAPAEQDAECVCKGNWRLILKGCEHLIGQQCTRLGQEWTFFGLVHAEDDYYYGLSNKDSGLSLLSCVGNLESWEVKFDAAIAKDSARTEDA